MRITYAEIEGLVHWLAQEAMEVFAIEGMRGGISLVPSALMETALERLSAGGLREAQAGSKRAAYARSLAMRWPVKILYEERKNGRPYRYSIVLPKDARQLELSPDEGQKVVVFISGEIFEIWPLAEWRKRERHPAGAIAEDLE